jgi:CheY-like chemotaxis protein/predicted transcriptional regulator with HTH domain
MKKILVVEDESIIAMELEKHLTEMGYDVVGRASSSVEAIAKAKELRPDLILMDIVIPGEKDGIDVAKEIKSELDVPVIFVTAYADEEHIKRAKKVEPFGYLVKPYEDRELRAGIEVALYKKEKERRLQKAHDKMAKANEQLRQEIKATSAKRTMNYFMDVLGLATLVAFTLVIVLIALLSQGALLYYYEPNKVIWIVEVFLGSCALIIGIRKIKEPLLKWQIMRSLRKSRVRREIIMYLNTIYPEASYPTDIARNTGMDATNVLGGLRGLGSRFGKSKSLLEIGLVDMVEHEEGTSYQLSKRGKSLIVKLMPTRY